jgi:hypothetical protein
MASRLLVLLFAASLPVAAASAQSGEAPASSPKDAVRATIDALFDGMRAGDSTAVRAVFAANARLQTALGPGDTTAVRTTPIDAFVAAVGRPHEKVWDERIWDVEIRVDGPLASAWVPYVFYHGDERSHCGVNAMQFVRHADGWRILQITDTRRQECDVPDRVKRSG